MSRTELGAALRLKHNHVVFSPSWEKVIVCIARTENEHFTFPAIPSFLTLTAATLHPLMQLTATECEWGEYTVNGVILVCTC